MKSTILKGYNGDDQVETSSDQVTNHMHYIRSV